MSKGTYSHSNRHRMHKKVSKFNFLGNELQVTNSDELAVHICRESAKSMFKDMIRLEDENHELRKMLDKAFDAGFEFDESTFLDDWLGKPEPFETHTAPQVTNSDETALHIARELAKSRFEDIIKLENENHEQRGQMALLREEIKELNEAMGGLLETSDYWRDECLKLKGLSHKLENEKHELQKQVDELTHMHQAISMVAGLPRKDEMETLIKDGKRLDWLQSSDLSLHCPNEGDVWMKEGVYRIRQYIDKAMNQPTQ